ncbi:MAG: DUF1501 domain-containing protein [Gemmataceae bacterium]|nr:DUF1501 domain-containing protein [Gemmataceae bacterium]MDW8267287.1 DUF1501 domain-containing protein [Gemmataceae bacterium]
MSTSTERAGAAAPSGRGPGQCGGRHVGAAESPEFLFGLGATLGTLAFNALLHAETSGPLTPKAPHLRPRARRVVWLFMEGGPSHIDTFDPKAKLAALHLKQFARHDRFASAMASGNRQFVASPYRFRQVGQSGLWMCEHWQHLARVADELCVCKGCVAESIDHPTACFHMNTGNRFGGDPAVGAWVSYGLGRCRRPLPRLPSGITHVGTPSRFEVGPQRFRRVDACAVRPWPRSGPGPSSVGGRHQPDSPKYTRNHARRACPPSP